MPKVAKKRRFHGTPFWETKQVEQDATALLPDQSVPSEISDESDTNDSGKQEIQETASTRKLETFSSPTSSSSSYENCSSLTYRMVELSSLMQVFQQLHKCKGGKMVYMDEQAKRYGNSSLIHIECTKCKQKAYLQTSANDGGCWKAKNACDINRRMVYSSCEMGVGREAIAVMCDILNMPPPCQLSSWNEHSDALYYAHKEAVDEKLSQAREFVHELHRKRNADLSPDDVIDIAVSFDGTWSKRGFTANFGVGFVISVETGQVLDYDFASKICVQCSRKKGKCAKESEEFQLWYAVHQPNCTENHYGTSGSMEQDIAKRIWNRSLTYNLQFKFMVSDGDSKAYARIWDTYGACAECNKWENADKKKTEYKKWMESLAYDKWKSNHEFGKVDCARVMKLDCIGHVQKRMGTALREFRKKNSGKLKDGFRISGKNTD